MTTTMPQDVIHLKPSPRPWDVMRQWQILINNQLIIKLQNFSPKLYINLDIFQNAILLIILIKKYYYPTSFSTMSIYIYVYIYVTSIFKEQQRRKLGVIIILKILKEGKIFVILYSQLIFFTYLNYQFYQTYLFYQSTLFVYLILSPGRL